MSNYLAIATVTATLQRILQSAIEADVEGARVTTIRPDGIGRSTPETGVNIYLYKVTPVNWRNADLPTRRTSGVVVKRPQIALDLNYILTFYGNEVELQPQRLLGSVLRTLHARPILSQEIIEATINDSTFWYLRESDLSQEVESIKVIPLILSTEDLSKIWSVFFQTPYSLSVAYQASVVLIESEDIPRRALPVRDPQVRTIPYKPIIDQIISLDELRQVWRGNPAQPILADSPIKIVGRILEGEKTLVRIRNTEVYGQEVSQQTISVNLASFASESLRAGIQSLQVVHRDNNNSRIVESNIFPFVLIPKIITVQISSIKNIENRDDDSRLVDIIISTNPFIGKGQQLILLLNEISIDNPQEYKFKIPSRQEDTQTIPFTIPEIKTGDYLVRSQVDDVESLLDVDNQPNSASYQQYIAPRISLT